MKKFKVFIHHIFGCLVALLALALGEKNMVLAQPVLERLENQIRQHVSPSRENSPPQRTPAIPSHANEPQGNQPFISPSSVASSPDKARAVDRPEAGYLGVVADDRNDRGRGVRIIEVRAGGPAAKAGVRKQDLVTALAGIRVRQLSEMTEILALYMAGDVVEFDILRDGRPGKIKVTLGRRPDVSVARGLEKVGPVAEIIPLPPGELILSQPLPEKSSAVSAAADLQPQLREKESDNIERLQKRIIELERRVADLERALSEAEKNK